MVEEPSHIKQLSLNHVCKIGLSDGNRKRCALFRNTPEYEAPLQPTGCRRWRIHPYVAAPIFSLVPTPVLS
jgi:hypothetical protein